MSDFVTTIAIALVLIICWVSLVGCLFGICWTYSLNIWLTYFDKPTIELFWTGWILGVVPGIGQLGLPLAVITFITHLFL